MSGVIVTVTLNAALHLDYAAGEADAEGIRPVSRPGYRASGRGVTAAKVLRAFGHDVLAAGAWCPASFSAGPGPTGSGTPWPGPPGAPGSRPASQFIKHAMTSQYFKAYINSY